MLRKFHIKNFKSLVDFTLDDMGQFVCLTGLNGAGKTTVLQAIDFVAHLAAGGLSQWFKDRDWNEKDIQSNLTTRKNIAFEVIVDVPAGTVKWEGLYNLKSFRCTSERLTLNDSFFLRVEKGKVTWGGPGNEVFNDTPLDVSVFAYEGSILSLYTGSPNRKFTNGFEVKDFFSQVKSLELLSPSRLRSRSRKAEDVGLGGEKLAGYIHQLTPRQKSAVETDLKDFYPNLSSLRTKVRTGLVQMRFGENYPNPNTRSSLEIEARHINDGLLRILTLIAQVQTNHQFLLFDEIENGINPELVKQLMDYLLSAKQQIMVTTHNPVILNFLPDESAKESVYFLYRTERGETKVTKFFDIPEVAEKLEILGPGEVFLDTSLTQLAAELGKS